MKKSFLLMASVLFLTGCTFAQGNDFIASVQNDFSNAAATIKNDMKTINQQKLRGSDSPLSLQDLIDKTKAERDRELEPVKKQIAQKEALMRNTLINMKLKASQKKAKLTILQNEINRVLSKMKQNGKLQELEEKWMGNDESKKELDNYNYDDSKGTIKFATVSGSAPFAYMKNNKIVGYSGHQGIVEIVEPESISNWQDKLNLIYNK